MQVTTTEPKLDYADALLAASKWLVDAVGDAAPADLAFISWYAQAARKYTLASAWNYYWWGEVTELVLRPEEREVPSPNVRGEGVLLCSDEQGREVVPASQSHSLYEGVILYGG